MHAFCLERRGAEDTCNYVSCCRNPTITKFFLVTIVFLFCFYMVLFLFFFDMVSSQDLYVALKTSGPAGAVYLWKGPMSHSTSLFAFYIKAEWLTLLQVLSQGSISWRRVGSAGGGFYGLRNPAATFINQFVELQQPLYQHFNQTNNNDADCSIYKKHAQGAGLIAEQCGKPAR